MANSTIIRRTVGTDTFRVARLFLGGASTYVVQVLWGKSYETVSKHYLTVDEAIERLDEVQASYKAKAAAKAKRAERRAGAVAR